MSRTNQTHHDSDLTGGTPVLPSPVTGAALPRRRAASPSTGWAARFTEPRVLGIALLVLALAGALVGAGVYLPFDSHEARPAIAARGMIRTGEWIVPYANARPRLEKPPVGPWLIASVSLLDASRAEEVQITEREARLPSAIGGVILVGLTALLALVVFDDRRAALAAGALYATSAGYITYTHSARPEMLYAMFTGGQLVAAMAILRLRGAWRAASAGEEGDARPAVAARRRAGREAALGILMWLSIAGALMTKGPFLPAFIMAGLVIVPLAGRRWTDAIAVVRPLTGVIVIALTLGLWVWIVTERLPNALEFWRAEMFDRTGGAAEWWRRPLEMGKGLWAFQLLAPWLALAPGAMLLPWRKTPPLPDSAQPSFQVTGETAVPPERARESIRRRERTIWFAFVTPLVILSLSRGWHGYYMLPAATALAALMGGWLVRSWDHAARTPDGRRTITRWIRLHAFAAAAPAIFALAAIFIPQFEREVSTARNGVAGAMAVVAMAGAFLVIRLARLREPGRPQSARLGEPCHPAPERGRHAVAAGVLIACVGVLWISLVLSGAIWSRKRIDRAQFAKDVARVAPKDQDMFALDDDMWLVVFYADRLVIEPVRDDVPSPELANHRGALVLHRLDKHLPMPYGAKVLLQQAPDVYHPQSLVAYPPRPGLPAAPGTDSIHP